MAKEPTQKEKLEIQKLELEIKNSSRKIHLNYFNTAISAINLGVLIIAGIIGYTYIQKQQVSFGEKGALVQEATLLFNNIKDKSLEEKVSYLTKHEDNPYVAREVDSLRTSLETKQKSDKQKLEATQIIDQNFANITGTVKMVELEMLKKTCDNIDYEINAAYRSWIEGQKLLSAEIAGAITNGTSGIIGDGVRAKSLRLELREIQERQNELNLRKQIYCLEPLQKLRL